MRIETEFLPYNLTKKLIELGYKRNTEALGGFYKYADEDRIFFMTAAEEATSSIRRDTKFEEIDAILWQQAFDWFRDGFNLNVFIHSHTIYKKEGIFWEFDIEEYKSYSGYKTYEEARGACLIKLIDLVQEKDIPIARVGSVFVLRNDPKRYYALTIKAGVVSVRNLNGISEWSKTFVPEDSNKITFGELESILPQNIEMDDLLILPEPEEIINLLKCKL